MSFDSLVLTCSANTISLLDLSSGKVEFQTGTDTSYMIGFGVTAGITPGSVYISQAQLQQQIENSSAQLNVS